MKKIALILLGVFLAFAVPVTATVISSSPTAFGAITVSSIVTSGTISAANLSGSAVSGNTVTAAQSIRITAPTALGTCAAGTEMQMRWVTGTGGTATGVRTQACMCTSDGAASPAYVWQNMVTGTLGTATTCAP